MTDQLSMPVHRTTDAGGASDRLRPPGRPKVRRTTIGVAPAASGPGGEEVPALARERARRGAPAVVSVPLDLLLPGESPRLAGQDAAHVARLAELDAPLPPILVDRRTMQVIDGTHRLMAAALNGRPSIDAVFFDGDPQDAFLRAVEANVTHGFPLSQADRRCAADRILRTHRHLSDRAIAQITGMSAKTVATLRHEAPEEEGGAAASRVGRDGRVRPVNGREGRARVAELISERPQASVRELARMAGVSPATASDVRKRLQRGEEPPKSSAAEPAPETTAGPTAPASTTAPAAPAARTRPAAAAADPVPVLEKLVRDPSLRHTDNGRHLLRLMQSTASAAKDLPELASALPTHCKGLVQQLAEQYAQVWAELARSLD
jgi:ParB-like chromosome segregation protein Spo0J